MIKFEKTAGFSLAHCLLPFHWLTQVEASHHSVRPKWQQMTTNSHQEPRPTIHQSLRSQVLLSTIKCELGVTSPPNKVPTGECSPLKVACERWQAMPGFSSPERKEERGGGGREGGRRKENDLARVTQVWRVRTQAHHCLAVCCVLLYAPLYSWNSFQEHDAGHRVRIQQYFLELNEIF